MQIQKNKKLMIWHRGLIHLVKENYMQKKEQVYEALRRLAIFKGDNPTDERLKLYCEYLEKYDCDKILFALKSLLENLNRFPDISDIIKLINPSLDANEDANVILGEIMEALASFGSMQSIEAKKSLGPIAWTVVLKIGGWDCLCKMGYSDLNSARAQMREMAKSVIKSSLRILDSNSSFHQISSTKKIKELMRDFENENLKLIDAK